MIDNMTFLIALLVLLSGIVDFSVAQSDQCLNETTTIAAVLNETLSDLPNPTDECLEKFQSGISDCVADLSSYVDELQTVCEDLGGKLFLGNVNLKCEFSAGIVNATTEPLSFTWDILSYSTCLGDSCSESDWDAIMERSFSYIDEQVKPLGGSCQSSIEAIEGGTLATTIPLESSSSPGAATSPTTTPVTTPSAIPATASPGSQTVEPSSNLNGTGTPTTASPGSPTVEPSSNLNGTPNELSPPSDAPASTPAPTSSTVTLYLSRHILFTIGVACWILVLV